MRELDPIDQYRIARCIVTENARGERRREARYWHPENVNAQQITIMFGHRVPESSS